jgi:hypothetical protein
VPKTAIFPPLGATPTALFRGVLQCATAANDEHNTPQNRSEHTAIGGHSQVR